MAALTCTETIQLLNNQTKDSNKLKLEVFKLAKRLQEENFLDEFVSQGGTEILLRTIQKEQGNVASYAMKALLHIFEADQTLSNISANQVMFQRLFELAYSSHGTVARNAVGLLAVFCEYAEDGFNLVDTGAQHALCSHSDLPPYKQVVVLLSDKDVKTQKEAANLLHVLLVKSVSVGRLQAFVDQLLGFQLAETLEDVEAKTPSQDLINVIKEIRIACNLSTPVTSGKDELLQEIEKASAALSLQQWRMSSLNVALDQQFGGEQLSGRVRAIHGIAAIAGEIKPDNELLKTLQSYIQKMEKSMSELKAEKVELQEKKRRESEDMEKRQSLQYQQLVEQQKKLELTLQKLEKTAEERVKTHESTMHDNGPNVKLLQDQIEQLQKNQKLLMQGFEEQQGVVAQRNYLQQHPQLWTFYQIVQMKLNEIFLASKVLASGLVQGEVKTQRSKVHYVIQLAGEAIPLPGAKLASTLINGTINYFVQKKSKRKADLSSGLAVTVSAMEKLSEEAARSLAFRFEEQLRCLTSKGVRTFSECGVRRMLEAMRSGLVVHDSTNYQDSLELQSLVNRLVDATVAVEAKQGALKIKNKKIETKQRELNWTEAGIFMKTGIRTLDDRYFDGKQTRPEKYGYRLGDDKHVSQMCLTEAPCRAKSLVGSCPTLSPIKKKALETKLKFPMDEKVAVGGEDCSSSVSAIAPCQLTTQPSKSLLINPETTKQNPVVTRRGSDPSPTVPKPLPKIQSKKPPIPKRPFSPRRPKAKTFRQSKPSTIPASGRRGSVPLIEAHSLQVVARVSPVRSKSAHSLSAHKKHQLRSKPSARELVPALPRKKSIPSSGDKVLVDRSLLEHYEQRLSILESKLEELSTIKKQMHDMQVMMRSLLSLNQGSTPLGRISCSSPTPTSPHPPLPPLPHFTSFQKSNTPPQVPRRLAT